MSHFDADEGHCTCELPEVTSGDDEGRAFDVEEKVPTATSGDGCCIPAAPGGALRAAFLCFFGGFAMLAEVRTGNLCDGRCTLAAPGRVLRVVLLCLAFKTWISTRGI